MKDNNKKQSMLAADKANPQRLVPTLGSEEIVYA